MKIKISLLKEGLNDITFEHSSDSLNLNEDEEFEQCFTHPVKIKATINKVGVQYFFHVIFDTIAHFTCYRCLDEFEQAIHDEFRLVYSTEKEFFTTSEEENDIRLLSSETIDIDITNDIRESLLLTIPMKILCSEDCKGLCSQCGVNWNHETCNCRVDHIDPRWEALKKIYQE